MVLRKFVFENALGQLCFYACLEYLTVQFETFDRILDVRHYFGY